MGGEPRGAAALRPDKTDAIKRAVLGELAARGWANLTVDAVAARAGVGKPAIYRRWRSRDEMVLACVIAAGVEEALPQDTGNLRDDLLGFTRQTSALLSDPLAGRVVVAVLSALSTDAELAAQVARRFRDPRRRAARAAFERAIARSRDPRRRRHRARHRPARRTVLHVRPGRRRRAARRLCRARHRLGGPRLHTRVVTVR